MLKDHTNSSPATVIDLALRRECFQVVKLAAENSLGIAVGNVTEGQLIIFTHFTQILTEMLAAPVQAGLLP